jgi:hypothetical protein
MMDHRSMPPLMVILAAQKRIAILILSCVFSPHVLGQSKPKPKIQRHDSGMSGTQLKLEEDCDRKIRQAGTLRQKGDTAQALELLDAA